MQPGYEFVEARFIDEDHLNVAVMWKSPEEQLIEEVISSDPTQPQWNRLMKHTTEKAVWDRTAEWKLEEKKKFDEVYAEEESDYEKYKDDPRNLANDPRFKHLQKEGDQ